MDDVVARIVSETGWKLGALKRAGAEDAASSGNAAANGGAGASGSADVRGWIALLLALCAVVRLALIGGGGQYFLPDELRFGRALRFLAEVQTGGWQAAGGRLLSYPDHTFFGMLALPAAAASLVGGLQIGTAVLAMASVANVGLVYAVARRAGAKPEIGLVAAFLMATATSMTYYARHLLGYDLSLCLVLLATWLGLRAESARRAAAGGALASAAFLTYNGYWAIVAAAVVLALVWPRPGVRRGFGAALGFVLPIAVVVGVNVLGRDGAQVLADVGGFARSVTMGDAREGWLLPWEYLWVAERGTVVVWGLGSFILVMHSARGRWPRGVIWLVAALGVYALLATTSTGLGYFAVAGRHARQLVPLLCLAAAEGLWLVFSRRALLVLCALTLVQSGVNLAPAFAIDFPASFEARVGPLNAAHTWSVVGPPDEGDPLTARYVLVNAGVIWPVLGPREPPNGRVIARSRQPLDFLPYRYEGYRPEERELLRTIDISMRLIDTAD